MRMRKEIKSVFVKPGFYKNCPVLEFRVNGRRKSKAPDFIMGRWKLEVILRQIADVKAFISADMR